MALQRGVRKGNFLTPEPTMTVETSVGPELLTEMRTAISKIDGVAGQVRDMRNNLMGSGEPNLETPFGRLPMAEADIKQLKSDVAALKSAGVSGSAQWSVAKVIWAFVAACIVALLGGGFEALIAWVLLKR